MSHSDAHMFTLGSVLRRAHDPDLTELEREDIPELILRCRYFLSLRVPCGEGNVQLRGAKSAIQAFMEYEGWRTYPDIAESLNGLFADYVKAGYILVDGPREVPIHSDTGYPVYWSPIEQAVVDGAMDTMMALIENGADHSKVVGGDLMAFIKRSQTFNMVPVFQAGAAQAIMKRRMHEGMVAVSENFNGDNRPSGRRKMSV